MASPAGRSLRHVIRSETQVITSRDNRWLKRFRAALSGKGGEGGVIGVEGVHMVEAALGSGLTVEVLLLSESGTRHLPRLSSNFLSNVPIIRTTDKLFAGVADTKTPQGVAALVKPRSITIENLMTGVPLVITLVGVQDPGNVGTIIRAAEAFGATGVATCPAESIGTADPFNPKALRASVGSAFRLPIVRGVSPVILLTQFRVFGVKSYSAVPSASWKGSGKQVSGDSSKILLPWEVNWSAPAAILIGNEGAGLAPDLARSVDGRVSIPQSTATGPAGLESLNAAMAASILLYEAMRQRNSRLENHS